ncbi:MAG: hypothetical protein ABFD08_08755 [Syntrophomonas sp.]
MKIYEEISGAICSYDVSCDFDVDWMRSININITEGSNRSHGRTGNSCTSTGKIVDAVYHGAYPRQDDIP